MDLLAEITHEIAKAENNLELLELTGQTEQEIEDLLKTTGAIEDEPEVADERPEETLECPNCKFRDTESQFKGAEKNPRNASPA